MDRNNIPYANVLRPFTDVPRLTGVFLARFDEFYSEKYQEQQKLAIYGLGEFKQARLNDENVLALMCRKAHGWPAINETYRPLHGLHMSLSRRHQDSPMGVPITPVDLCPLLQTRQMGLFFCMATTQMERLRFMVNVGVGQIRQKELNDGVI